MNKKSLSLLVLSYILCMNLHAQDVPNAIYFLPVPTNNPHSAQFINDQAQYEWGKSMRETNFGDQARSDMSWQLNSYLSTFSNIVGVEFSDKNTPYTYDLLKYGMTYADKSIKISQSSYLFQRPYVYFDEPSLITSSENQYKDTSSYPSAQAVYGWLLGMLLSEVCPDKQDTILHRSYEMGTSSIIAGYNWQSDTEVGRELACALVSFIHSHQGLLYQIKMAQDEYQRKKARSRRSSSEPYLYAEDLPDPTKYLPDPPVEGTALYDYDVTLYNDNKSIRETSRGQTAVDDADSSLENLISIFSRPFGKSISASSTPEIYELLSSMYPIASEAILESKAHYSRVRPYVLFDEHTGYPADEDDLRDSGAYPSGHSFLGWLVALTLSEVNPSQLTALMKRAYEFGQSRVILGYHWQTDVTAGRLVAGAVFARLHGSRDFINQMERAIDEFKGASSIKAPETSSDAEAPIYTIGGVRLNGLPTRHGIYIQGHKKVVR